MAMEPKVRTNRACDACRARKVKCNGQERCQQCSHLGLRCIYATAKPRAQGRRGRVISEFKRKNSSNLGPMAPILPVPVSVSHEDSSTSGSIAPRELSGTPEDGIGPLFFLELIPDYMSGVYPVQPVIAEEELQEYIREMETDQDVRSFIYAFGACTLNLTRNGIRRTDEVQQKIEQLVHASIQTRRLILPNLHSSVMNAMQSMFLHNCLMTMQASDAAFYYLRDAISHIQLLRIDNPEFTADLTPKERARRQRLYWQAFIHERFVAVLDYRQAILPPLASLPDDDPTLLLSIQEGFNQIIRLFRLLDPEFLKNWLDTQGTSHVTSSWVEAKSRELEANGEEEAGSQSFFLLNDMQRADLTITREWLRTLVWRLAMSQTLLSSRSSKECLSLLFPVRLSQQLRQQVTSMSREDIEIHGSSIVQKLFEMTDTIADVLIHVPVATLEETRLRIEDFLFLLDFVLLFPTLDRTRRGILTEKLAKLQAMFPEVANSPSVQGSTDTTHSPPNDPWYYVTQSKLASDMGFDAAVSFDDSQLRPILHVPEQVASRTDQRATWNNISQRLNTVNIPEDR